MWLKYSNAWNFNEVYKGYVDELMKQDIFPNRDFY